VSALPLRRLHGCAPPAGAARQRGFSLIELSVAILIALFLIGGVIAVEQGVHRAYGDQSGIGKLQDEERFAMAVLTEVVSSAGYFPNPATTSLGAALPATGSPLNMAVGQSIYGPATGASAPHDSIYVRYMAASGGSIELCDGTTATNLTYTSWIYVSGNELYCQVQAGTGAGWNTAAPLVNGITDMQIWYGVNTSGTDNTVDTYIPQSALWRGGTAPNRDIHACHRRHGAGLREPTPC
jgi:type IV pilus assembly protein PilW